MFLIIEQSKIKSDLIPGRIWTADTHFTTQSNKLVQFHSKKNSLLAPESWDMKAESENVGSGFDSNWDDLNYSSDPGFEFW